MTLNIFSFTPIYDIAEAKTSGKYDFSFIPIIQGHRMARGDAREVRAKLLSLSEFAEFFSFNSFDKKKETDETDDEHAEEKKTTAAVSEIKKTDWRPAKDSELFGFAAKFPDEQKNGPILAMGTVISNSKGKPSIFWLGASSDKDAPFEKKKRHLGITSLELDSNDEYYEDWSPCRFLVVHK